MSPRRRDAPPGPTAAARLAEDLRRRVLDGDLAPGTALREEELARRWDLSRHTVRTALVTLVTEGLATSRPYHGTHVTQHDDGQLVALQQLRCALESEAVRLTRLRHGDAWPAAVLAPVEAALADLASTGGADDWPATAAAHGAVHQALVETAGSPRLAAAYRALHGEVLLLLVHLRPASSAAELVTEHRAYLAEVQREGEPAVRRHVERATATILRARRGGIGPLACCACPTRPTPTS